MNQTRSFLLIAWLVVATLLWMEWSKSQLAPTEAPATTTPAAAAIDSTAPAPAPIPGLAPAGAATALPTGAPAMSAATPAASAASRPITLASDTLRLTVDLQGGRIIDSQLLQYTLEKKPGSPNVHLLTPDPSRYEFAEAGLIRVRADGVQEPLSPSFATANGGANFELPAGAAALVVPLQWTDAATGLQLQRTLTLRRGSYVLEVEDRVANPAGASQRLFPYERLARITPPAPPRHSFMTNPESLSFVGAAWYTPAEKVEKAKFTDFAKTKPPAGAISDGWVAMLQHHFATAWVPKAGEAQTAFDTSVESWRGTPLYSVRVIGPALDVGAGQARTHAARLWVGPKLQKPMAEVSPELWRTVDYGVLTFVSQPLFWLLALLHKVLGNWGWAIIAIVVLLKLALYPLSAKQYQSMAKMRAVQPRIEALKERYGEDKQGFQLAMMDLYKKEKINPLGGCLPMLIPFPIFLGLYWVLLETVELRHAPWMGWIQNLTAADPYFVLPALNLAVMFLTQRLTPMPGMDPVQKKIMTFMPLVFGVMMAFFPSGLVLYWVTNGLLGLLQQWWMTKRHGPRDGGAKPATVAR